MKNLKFILLFAISIAMLSCSSDDDGDSEPTLTNELLAGTYDFTFLEKTTVIVDQLDTGEVTTTIKEVGENFQDSNITFNSDGTYSLNYEYSLVTTTTSSTEGSEPIVEEETINESSTGIYEAVDFDQLLTLSDDDDEVNGSVNIEILTSNLVTLFDGNELRLELPTFEAILSDGSFTADAESRFIRRQ